VVHGGSHIYNQDIINATPADGSLFAVVFNYNTLPSSAKDEDSFLEVLRGQGSRVRFLLETVFFFGKNVFGLFI